jgi:hypothetical protein
MLASTDMVYRGSVRLAKDYGTPENVAGDVKLMWLYVESFAFPFRDFLGLTEQIKM